MSSHAASRDSSLPTPPFVLVPGVPNVRDIGGYPTNELYHHPRSSIRRGLIYRGGEPTRITPEGRAAFKALGIKKVYDIRTQDEIGTEATESAIGTPGSPIVELEGTERIRINVLAEDNFPHSGQTEAAQAWKKMGKNTTERFITKVLEVLDHGDRLLPIFAHLAAPDPAPIYVHCHCGKDRTGTVVMLLLRLAGVPKDIVAEEYALTDLGIREETPRMLERLLKNPGLGLNEETMREIMVARKEYVLGLCDVLEERYGGAQQYFGDYLKMSASDVKAIRSALIADEEPIFGEEEETKEEKEIVN
ncbi:MAG: hypothetical protein Q9168_007934, partial [Polycauliona sp. 1 TL-2023]